MSKKKNKWQNTLVYSQNRKNTSTINKHYKEYCAENNIEYKCATKSCSVRTLWLNKDIKLEIDHINGVKGDNRPENLQYLCPNCHSQQDTSGGKNKGRVEASIGGFAIKNNQGNMHYTLPIETEEIPITAKDLNLKKPERQTEP